MQQLGVPEICHRDGHGINPPPGPQLKQNSSVRYPVLHPAEHRRSQRWGRRWQEVVAVQCGGMKMESIKAKFCLSLAPRRTVATVILVFSPVTSGDGGCPATWCHITWEDATP